MQYVGRLVPRRAALPEATGMAPEVSLRKTCLRKFMLEVALEVALAPAV